jgi:aerobic carbon-monoxide dehydrogenase medium subunit
MKAPAFTYYAPATTTEVVKLLTRLDNARVLGGGQSLMPMMNLRVATPDHLIDLGRIPALVGIAENTHTISIGAMTTQRMVEHSALLRTRCPLLTEAVDHVGHQQTRNRGTIGGSICHLDPGAELPVIAAALEAQLTIEGATGTRTLAFADFPQGYLTSALEPDEILTRIDFPKIGARTGSAFLEFNRRPADFAIVSVAVQLTRDDRDAIRGAAIAIGGIHYAPIRLARAETALAGRPLDDGALAEATSTLTDIPCDGDDLYPEEFRREICGVLLKRALRQAFARAGGHDG